MGPALPSPRGSSHSQNKVASSTAKESYPKVKRPATNWHLPVPLQQLLSSGELKATLHDVPTEEGGERVSVWCSFSTVSLAVNHELTLTL